MLENFGKKVGEIAKTASKKSGDMVGITKLNINIKTEESSIKDLYAEIGREYFISVNAGEDATESLEVLCNKVKEHKDNIERIRNEISQIKSDEE